MAVQPFQRVTGVIKRLDIARRTGESLVIALQRFLVAAKLGEHHAAVDVCDGKVGTQRERAVIGSQRFLEAPRLLEDVAPTEMRVGILRLHSDGAIAGLECLVIAFEPQQRAAAIGQGVDVIR